MTAGRAEIPSTEFQTAVPVAAQSLARVLLEKIVKIKTWLPAGLIEKP